MISRKKRNLFYLANSFSEKFGGRTQATFYRAEMLKNNAKNSFIMTFNYKLNYGQIIKNIREHRNISPQITFLNIFEFYADEDLYSIKDTIAKVFFKKREEYRYKYIESKNAYKVYNQSHQICYIQLANDNTINYIDYFDEKLRKIRRETYDAYGNKRKESFYDMRKNKVIKTNFLTKNERIFLSIDYDIESGKGNNCLIFDKSGKVKYIFDSETAMREFWLAKLNEKYKNAIFFCEDRELDELLAKNRYTDKIKSIPVIHSSHLRKPYTFGSRINEYNGRLLSKIDRHSAVVVLTNEQLKHINNQIGIFDNLYQIPHSVNLKKNNNNLTRDNNKIVVISRFVEIKRIIDILKAFLIVSKVYPEAKLELWGTGEEKRMYQEFIDENNLNQSVKIMGYTSKPHEVFHSAGFSVITSKYEGFGMTILESLSNGTPVIAYDFNYGPRELINNGLNGFVVPNGDIESLADKMEYLVKNKEILNSFSKQAQQDVKKFDIELIKSKWVSLIEDVEKASNFKPKKLYKRILLSELIKVNASLRNENDIVQVEFNIHNTVSVGESNERYYVYIENYFDLDKLDNRYVVAEKVESTLYNEVIIAKFDFDVETYNELKKDNKIKLKLGISSGRNFSFVDVNHPDRIFQ
ncbi:glycosyltransferase [Oceanobacillus halophilus]|uniref:Glycosyltransferase n=1 Tax=Oceanobacillus halophilus TaxID=930130 RepID=A0A495A5E7_9BACI|nr:glycosyltransferase [Oceanobacillus halophilus]RKQ34313.1 glycosyltransferase [Oceanobacillus halophilus]